MPYAKGYKYTDLRKHLGMDSSTNSDDRYSIGTRIYFSMLT